MALCPQRVYSSRPGAAVISEMDEESLSVKCGNWFCENPSKEMRNREWDKITFFKIILRDYGFLARMIYWY